MKYVDITGQKFGELTVLRRVANRNNKVMLECECSCGKIIIVQKSNLTSGNTTACGHNKINIKDVDKQKRYDLTGQTFGYWTVLYKAEPKHSKSGKSRISMWHCRCKCGTERDVNTTSLRNGRSKSCGCYNKEVVSQLAVDDITGKKFGYLTVLERHGSVRRNNNRSLEALWKCQCDCGKIIYSHGEALKNGDKVSCGCKKISSLEYLTMKYLDDNNIKYTYQKSYDDLVGIGGKLLSYDFLVYKNDKPYCLIECQGKQHYKCVEYFGGEKTFNRVKNHDERKKKYASKINLPLFEIDFKNTEYSQICELMESFGIKHLE